MADDNELFSLVYDLEKKSAQLLSQRKDSWLEINKRDT